MSRWGATLLIALAAGAGCKRAPDRSDGPLGADGDSANTSLGRLVDAARGASDEGGPSDGGVEGADAPRTCGGCLALEQCWEGRLCVAKAIAVPAGFSVDATEVTRSQYAAWLATGPSTAKQAVACAWNDSFTPDPTCMARPSVCAGAACAQHPQPCVDLCDAAAYCQAVGKKLCGAWPGQPPLTWAQSSLPEASQWLNACTSNGANAFTYGAAPLRGYCNDYLSFSRTTVPVGSQSLCHSPVSGYAGIFDLIGNVAEWEDNCQGAGDRQDVCKPRGLSFGSGAASPRCDQQTYAKRSEVSETLGFRCCSP